MVLRHNKNDFKTGRMRAASGRDRKSGSDSHLEGGLSKGEDLGEGVTLKTEKGGLLFGELKEILGAWREQGKEKGLASCLLSCILSPYPHWLFYYGTLAR